MPDHNLPETALPHGLTAPPEVPWPEGLTRVPYWVFQREDVAALEQTHVFRGETWNYLCLEAEIAKPGDYRATTLGGVPILAVRDHDGEIYAFENRCVHRGALIALEDFGHAREFTCVYHAWSYDLQGNLKGVAFKDGINGQGGMPECFRMSEHSPRKLRTAVVHGLVFASASDTVPPIEEYLGDEIMERIDRVLGGREVEVIGRFTQELPNNWKLYVENVRDSYHASLLHLFFTTFELNRLNMKGGLIVSESGGNHVSYSAIDREAEAKAKAANDYAAQNIRSESDYRLKDPSVLEGQDEFGDGVTLQILSVFPGFVLQQIQNALAIRQVVPRGVGRTDLHWTYIGFKDDTPELRKMRLKQGNLVGPAGYVSMEDGCVGGFVQRGVVGASDRHAVLEMGGADASSTRTRATEASVRGFWKAYRECTGL
ncbi:aromatic ring-hydroxylating dioxygenase subunit alpha [Roseomonas xinghualingensis]|uniref:aromatic ring-hydroxylating dioxygenase subunit alpha n=1 Tax=Roseomonas xinghualingensis TaxID=2986475 RepID=UPI0021F23458|nr:aromatic ring-hydroxylating dioxygenase subunit alpha [Roseomonas sp. SXEYE001]MCV4210229.1 aromatic ring-hydroxylating dioxygenase subunit alpha [Roseomonas sp. SXEYE001]